MPCTDEYFYKNNKNNLDGLFPYCKECDKNKTKNWRINNPEKFKIIYLRKGKDPKEIIRVKMASKAQRGRGYFKEYQKNNKQKFKQYSEKRQHKNHKITKNEWKSCKEYFSNCCAYCGLPIEQHFTTYKEKTKLSDFHKEHVIHNGANDLSNCIPSCKECNSKKWIYDLEDWYNEKNSIFNQSRLDKIYKWLNADYKNYINNKNN